MGQIYRKKLEIFRYIYFSKNKNRRTESNPPDGCACFHYSFINRLMSTRLRSMP